MNIFGFGSKKKQPQRPTQQRVEAPQYATKEDIKKQVDLVLKEKELSEHRRRLWNNLSRRQKLKVLKYNAAKRRT
jgi:hypothetical protein